MDLSENVKELDIVSVSHFSIKSVQIKGSPMQIFFLKAPVKVVYKHIDCVLGEPVDLKKALK